MKGYLSIILQLFLLFKIESNFICTNTMAPEAKTKLKNDISKTKVPKDAPIDLDSESFISNRIKEK